jgi:hypothetical protein
MKQSWMLFCLKHLRSLNDRLRFIGFHTFYLCNDHVRFFELAYFVFMQWSCQVFGASILCIYAMIMSGFWASILCIYAMVMSGLWDGILCVYAMNMSGLWACVLICMQWSSQVYGLVYCVFMHIYLSFFTCCSYSDSGMSIWVNGDDG